MRDNWCNVVETRMKKTSVNPFPRAMTQRYVTKVKPWCKVGGCLYRRLISINREKSEFRGIAHRCRKAARACRIAPRHFRYKTVDYANARPGSMESKNVSDFLYEIARPRRLAGCDLRKRHAPGTRDRQRRLPKSCPSFRAERVRRSTKVWTWVLKEWSLDCSPSRGYLLRFGICLRTDADGFRRAEDTVHRSVDISLSSYSTIAACSARNDTRTRRKRIDVLLFAIAFVHCQTDCFHFTATRF